MNHKDLAKHELIGLTAEVVDSKNEANLGIKGKIRDETKNTIVIDDKRLFKNNITLKIIVDKNELIIKGDCFSGRPKERIKNG
jgi:ribonuclease P protein subunit POP4